MREVNASSMGAEPAAAVFAAAESSHALGHLTNARGLSSTVFAMPSMFENIE